ncbi:RNA dependent RNA polymerase-domain-containing protein [Crassisporium funariophilum]|nr:RNA dependent RNA polymerase-domain-containing protein [Crassisporium funariophilum]
MNLGIKYLPYEVNEWTVTRKIAEVLHSEDFAPKTERPINFRVELGSDQASGVRNDGTGTLTVPTEKIAHKFLDYVNNDPIKIEKKKIKFFKRGQPSPWLAATLQKTPYVNPDKEEERQEKLAKLDSTLRVAIVQFGVFHRPKYPTRSEEALSPRDFSIEWERDYVKDSCAWITVDYDHKLIRMTLGDELTEKDGYDVCINFSSLKVIGAGYDFGEPYICFDTLTPPTMEKIDFHRPMTGEKKTDYRNFKQRVTSIHDGHEVVAPYAAQIRVVLFRDPTIDLLQNFIDMCGTAGLTSETRIIRLNGPSQIVAIKQGFFSRKRLHNIQQAIKGFDWPVAFQLELLLRNALLHTGDLEQLLPHVSRLCKSRANHAGTDFVSSLLRQYSELLRRRDGELFQTHSTKSSSGKKTEGSLQRRSPIECFELLLKEFEFSPADSDWEEASPCRHVMFTPTRMLLEGPYDTQSNRVIRDYKGYEDHFVRVEFRDEDCMHYRWDKEVDGASFIQQRVGSILKGGFTLAGRQFEFLAYSSSALGEHAVWFMNPFKFRDPSDRIEKLFTSELIRKKLGKFEGDQLMHQPSKYAARLAQAFTATRPSIQIRRSEWEEIPDLEPVAYDDSGHQKKLSPFTDGVGTISKALGDKIWARLTKNRRDTENAVQPSAYLIRFLGYKGVVGVDEQLDKNPNGIQMRLRPSMGKFKTDHREYEPIEIAESFEHPISFYLNRPLVMLLEDVGVRIESFVALQDVAVADAKTIDESIAQFTDLMRTHNLGSTYRLSHILKRLKEKYNMELRSTGQSEIAMDNPFLRQVRQVAMTDILRSIKHDARLYVPESHLLVGIADEGPAYEAAGYKNVYTLGETEIYACIQKPGDPEPTWLEGNASISRSPVVHPGDVQRVRVIGKPPDDMLCLFRHMKNVVVLPSKGSRSLASCLGGGDVDGDKFAVVCHKPLLPTSIEQPASYDAGETRTLKATLTVIAHDVSTLEDHQIYAFVHKAIDEDPKWLEEDVTIAGRRFRALGKPPPEVVDEVKKCYRGWVNVAFISSKEYEIGDALELKWDLNMNDICDFIVEYINSDILGLLSIRHLQIADQSSEGIFDEDCLKLAELCSQAVDYKKQGIPVNMGPDDLPKTLIRCKPDWAGAEETSTRKSDYYESSRALGVLYRSESLKLGDLKPIPYLDSQLNTQPFSNPISQTLLEDVRPYLGDSVFSETPSIELSKMFRRYVNELNYICVTHSLSNTPGEALDETEVVAGTISAKCTQKGLRKERMYRMKLHASGMVHQVQRALIEDVEKASDHELVAGLEQGWGAWVLSLRRRNEFGANSFGLVALGTILDCLKKLESSGVSLAGR